MTQRSLRPLAAALAVTALTSAAGPVAAAEADGTTPQVTIASLPAVVYDAHRGGGLEARENSLSGLRSAYESGTVHVLDLDTRELADGTIVLMHDETVDRVTSATGLVSDYTVEGWKGLTLDIGSWLPWQLPAESPPTLEEVLDELGGATVLTVEAKDAESVDRIAAMVRRRSLEASVFVNTNEPQVARYISSLGLQSHLWRSAAQMRDEDPRALPDVDLIDLDIRADDAAFRRYVDAGFRRVWAHTLVTRAERDRALALGATGIITDNPRYISGSSDDFPAAPTAVRVVDPPRAAQVSDSTRIALRLKMQSGPDNPAARAGVHGRGVSSRTVSARDGINELRLTTVGARAGRTAVRIEVPAGRSGERRWLAGSARSHLRLTKEDLEVRTSAAVEGRRVVVATRVLDSAARAYRGPRPERARPTAAGVDRARLTLRLLRPDGEVVHRTRLASVVTQTPRTTPPAHGRSRYGWRAPEAGDYVVEVRQHGATYRTVAVTTRFRVE